MVISIIPNLFIKCPKRRKIYKLAYKVRILTHAAVWNSYTNRKRESLRTLMRYVGKIPNIDHEYWYVCVSERENHFGDIEPFSAYFQRIDLNRCLIWVIMVVKPDTDQAEGNCLFSWSMPNTLFYLECLHSTFEYFIRKRFVSGLKIFKSSKRIQEFTNSIEYFKQVNNTNVLDLWKGA